MKRNIEVKSKDGMVKISIKIDTGRSDMTASESVSFSDKIEDSIVNAISNHYHFREIKIID